MRELIDNNTSTTRGKKSNRPRKIRNTKSEPELPAMPAADPIAVTARRFLNHKATVQTETEAMETAGTELAGMMRTAKRKSINIDGSIIEFKHVDAKDVLKVKKQTVAPGA